MRLPLTAIEAFAQDMRHSSAETGGDRMHAWLSIASAAEVLSTLDEQRRLEFLAELDGSLLPPAGLRPSIVHDTVPQAESGIEAYVERFRVAVEEMERAGCLNLAFTTVSALNRTLVSQRTSDWLMNTVHLGRIARELSDTRTAVDCYRTVAQEGLRNRDGPSAARAYIGLAMVGVMRGNYPLVRKMFERALLHAHPGSNTEAQSHMGLSNVARRDKRLADALIHGWKAHDVMTDHEQRLGIVGNLATIALDAGFPSAAMNGFQYVLSKNPTPTVRLGVLYDAVLAAAELGDTKQLEQFESDALRTANEFQQSYEIGRMMLNVGIAWLRAGNLERAHVHLNHVVALSEKHGYNELTMRAEYALDEHTSASRRANRQVEVPTWDEGVSYAIRRLEALSV